MKAALIEIGTGTIIAIDVLPFQHQLADGGTALLTSVGQEVPVHDRAYRVMEYVEAAFERPGTYFTPGADVESRVGNVITVTRGWIAWTQPEIDIYEIGRRDAIVALFDNVDDETRNIALMMMDEFNLHSSRLSAILQAAANATTLTTFKSAMAVILPIAQRTPAQIRAAYRNKFGSSS